MRRVVSPAEFRSMPWSNGAGITHEIFRWPERDDRDDYVVRVSLAELAAAAPFSRFPGYRRWSFLAGAAPLALEIGGVPHELVALGDHLETAGDVAIACAAPPAPTRLLNLLVRDGADVRIGRGPCPRPVRFAFALAAQPGLPAGHAIVLAPPEPLQLGHDAVWLCDAGA